MLLLSVFCLQAQSSENQHDSLEKLMTKQWLQLGYSSNALGYGVNNFLADNKIKVFWGGRVHVKQGVSLNYQRNIINFWKVFAFDCGLNASWWQSSGKNEHFFTLSVFPVLRLNYLQTEALDAYFYYTVAGPSYITKTIIDDIDTGKHFTFTDNMGFGVFFGKQKKYNAELKIGHYSNGGFFPPNWGVKVPLSLHLGYVF